MCAHSAGKRAATKEAKESAKAAAKAAERAEAAARRASAIDAGLPDVVKTEYETPSPKHTHLPCYETTDPPTGE